MNEFDQFVKHELKVKHYARYTDDIIIISSDLKYLQNLIEPMETFLKEKLRLSFHPNKTIIRKYINGVDFLGYIILPHCILMRKRSKRRMFRKTKQKIRELDKDEISEETLRQTFESYYGILSHANEYKTRKRLEGMLPTDLNNEKA